MDAFTRGYIYAALFSTNDESDESGGVPLIDNYDSTDIAKKTLKKMESDCKKFQKEAQALLDEGTWSDEEAGQNFWLTRNGHGAGFWDEGTSVGKKLTDIADKYGSIDLYVGDNGKIYGYGPE